MPITAWQSCKAHAECCCLPSFSACLPRPYGQLPKNIWLAIGRKDWLPKPDGTPIRFVRFTENLLNEGIEIRTIEGVPVKIFGVAKTIADCFRYRNKIGLSVAIEGLQEALRQRRATPGEIASQAERGGVSTVTHISRR